MPRQLTREEAEKLVNALQPGLGFLSRLVARLNRQGFAPGDPTLLLAHEAQNSMQSLFVRLHYLSCDPGQVGH